ncbi:GAP family protein [Microterricola pindariensis]|uniref:GAP family protein n=1 Tax=Microterricola pindariensis TaxID=478010 RepID=UPI000CEC4332|nr:GAP family protein [Microterricola pindariensis]
MFEILSLAASIPAPGFALDSVDELWRSGFPLPLALGGLALVDSASFGTLLIPLWLLLVPGRLRPARVLLYLGTIVAFYFAVGLAIMAGANVLRADLERFLAATPVIWVQFLLGAGLLIGSFLIDTKKAGAEPGRITVWRARAMGVSGAGPAGPGAAALGGAAVPGTVRDTSMLPLMALALTAAGIELASMLPYLAGITLITGANVGWAASAGLLAAYCLVMVLPALLALAARLFAAGAVEPLLQRLSGWLSKNAAETTAWIVGIIGFLLARDAALKLSLFDGFLS